MKTITLSITEYETIKALLESEINNFKKHNREMTNTTYQKKIERLKNILSKIE
jgi:hypothetical protein